MLCLHDPENGSLRLQPKNSNDEMILANFARVMGKGGRLTIQFNDGFPGLEIEVSKNPLTNQETLQNLIGFLEEKEGWKGP